MMVSFHVLKPDLGILRYSRNCKNNGYPNLEGWVRTKNRQRNYENAVWKEVAV